MKFTNVNELLKKLISIPSISGDESALGKFLADSLEEQGFEVTRMPVDQDRINVFATIGQPKIVLQAHMDVVPPYIPADEDEEFIFGRGACDTKGSMASMITAAQNAKSKGISDFGLLFTVGEETDFAGAKAAHSLVEKLGAFLIVGEPTKLKPVTAHYGILVFSLVCTGKAAHSSEPALGENAIDTLISLLSRPAKNLRTNSESLMSIVKISGGKADNIIPDRAEAVFSFRISPNDSTDYAQELQTLVGDKGKVENVDRLPSVASNVPDSLKFLGEGESVKYCTELTFLKNGLVFGPGDIADAHTPTEKVKKRDLQSAVEIYERVMTEYEG